jgi:hypothetical protein
VASLTLSRAVGAKINDFRDVLTSYAMSLRASGAITSPNFMITPEMRAEFLRRLAARKVVIDSNTARAAGPVNDRQLGGQNARYVFGTDAEFRRTLDADVVVKRAYQVLSKAYSQKEAIDSAK